MLHDPISDLCFAVLDVETTGLAPEYGHRVCEIAVLRGREQEEEKRFQSLIHPERSIPPKTRKIHGITDEMVRDAPVFRDVLGDVEELLEGAVMVAHNAKFDLGFLSSELHRSEQNLHLDDVPVVDTCLIARKQFDFGSNSLDSLAQKIGLPSQPHRAMGDVVYTWNVLQWLIQKLAGDDVLTLRDLIEAQGGSIAVPEPDRDVELPRVIEEAITRGSALKIQYQSSGSGRTTRVIDPMQATKKDGSTYVVAYCRLREDQRSFRLDRIRDLEEYSEENA